MKRKILVIDDSELVRSIMAQILVHMGLETIEAEDGSEGLEMAEKYLPDLIFCDLVMPGLDGYQVQAQLQANSVTAQIPFVFLSGDPSPRFPKGQPQRFLPKPFMLKDLKQIVNTTLSAPTATAV
jgi:CheY-like chemotaxis protein